MKRFIIAFLLVGCAKPLGQPVKWVDGRYPIDVVIVTKHGSSPWIRNPSNPFIWLDEPAGPETRALGSIMRKCGLVTVITVTRVDRAELFDADAAALKPITAERKTVYLLNTISGNGKPVYGFAWVNVAFVAWPAGRNVVAHEVGHLFGLSHVNDRLNFMYGGSGPGDGVTREQAEIVQRGAVGVCSTTKCEVAR